jgi:hypothetical protein
MFEKTLNLKQKNANDSPGETGYRTDLAAVHEELAALLANNLKLMKEAEECHRKALTVLDTLAVDFPRQASYRAEAGWVHRRLAFVLMGLPGRFTDARQEHEQDISVFRTLAAEFPSHPAWMEQLAQGHRAWGRDLWKLGRREESEKSLGEAVQVLEKSSIRFPDAIPSHSALLAETLAALGRMLASTGRAHDAEREFRKALELAPGNAVIQNDLAWLLATCPEPELCVAAGALASAKRAIELAPNEGGYWNTLGVAHYRAGDWKAALQALNKSNELLKGNELSFNAFFIAMAHWQMGNKDEARTWFDRAVDWMVQHKPNDRELQRFRSEAEALLKIEAKSPRK